MGVNSSTIWYCATCCPIWKAACVPLPLASILFTLTCFGGCIALLPAEPLDLPDNQLSSIIMVKRSKLVICREGGIELTRMPGIGSQSAKPLEEEQRLLSCNCDLSGLMRDTHHPGVFRQPCL